jgi:hypothetical protein
VDPFLKRELLYQLSYRLNQVGVLRVGGRKFKEKAPRKWRRKIFDAMRYID